MKSLFLFVLIAAISIAYAEEVSGNKKHCGEALKKACGNVERGEGRKLECLEKSISGLPADCQEGAKKRLEKVKKMHEKAKVCRSEAENLCGSPKTDKKAFKECMKKNKDKVSSQCKELRQNRKDRREKRAGKK